MLILALIDGPRNGLDPLWEQGVGGSNPLAPTIFTTSCARRRKWATAAVDMRWTESRSGPFAALEDALSLALHEVLSNAWVAHRRLDGQVAQHLPSGCERAAVSKPLDSPVMACPVDIGADDAREPLHGLGELTLMDE